MLHMYELRFFSCLLFGACAQMKTMSHECTKKFIDFAAKIISWLQAMAHLCNEKFYPRSDLISNVQAATLPFSSAFNDFHYEKR